MDIRTAYVNPVGMIPAPPQRGIDLYGGWGDGPQTTARRRRAEPGEKRSGSTLAVLAG